MVGVDDSYLDSRLELTIHILTHSWSWWFIFRLTVGVDNSYLDPWLELTIHI